MRKRAFCIIENKDADQLQGNSTAEFGVILLVHRYVSIFLSFLIFSFILVDNSSLDIPDIEQKVKDMSKH